jgi:isocitrate dehydrogenase
MRTVANKTVTYDLARQMEGAKEVSLSAFAEEVAKSLA